MPFIDTLKNIDNAILLWINSRHSDTLDTLMWNASGRYTWIPLYLVLAYFIIQKYGKRSWLPIVCTIIAVVLADQASNHLFKNIIMRYRPSHNLTLQGQLHYVNGYIGGLYGFASSHASNTTAFAVFIILLFRKWLVTISLICWVLLVCYSRMYLGVHYPSDILGGMLIGIITGGGMFWIYVIVTVKKQQSNS